MAAKEHVLVLLLSQVQESPGAAFLPRSPSREVFSSAPLFHAEVLSIAEPDSPHAPGHCKPGLNAL